MSYSVNTNPQSYAGIGIYCNVIDPTKLPPDSPLLKNPAPSCTIVNGNGQNYSYPQGYYINNYNTTKKRVVVLTDTYIKNLENLLNDNDQELREYAASEVIKRLDEDKTRHNDKALNALVNKMILDPYAHKVRERGLIAIDSGLASGDENTRTILELVKHDPGLLTRDQSLVEKCLFQLDAQSTIVNEPITTRSVSV